MNGYKIVLSALAAQVSTKKWTLSWSANQVHKIDCVRHGAVSCSKTNSTSHRSHKGYTHLRSPLNWEKWQTQAKLGLIAKEIINLVMLLDPKPENVQRSLEPIYKNTIPISAAQSERERLARNAQLKMNWENCCQRQIKIGVMWGVKPWNQADRKAVSMFFLSLGTEGRIIICSRNSHLSMDTLLTVEL